MGAELRAHPSPILIAGPTASGKSALALRIAADRSALIINADSKQVYRDWRVLSARPDEEEEAAAPHRLYGTVDAAVNYSVGDWLRDIEPIIWEAKESGRTLIIIGGTGLYFKGLTEGLAHIPPIDPRVRAEVQAWEAAEGVVALAAYLRRYDPQSAARVDLQNPMRVMRAIEVLESTGRSIASWGAHTPPPLLQLTECATIVLEPERDWLYARINTRFEKMIERGALEEAQRVMARQLDPALPAMKTHGAPELMAHLRGEMPLDTAISQAQKITRNYAKRQGTWFRNQMRAWNRLTAKENYASDEIFSLL